jgi:hypothetical protein
MAEDQFVSETFSGSPKKKSESTLSLPTSLSPEATELIHMLDDPLDIWDFLGWIEVCRQFFPEYYNTTDMTPHVETQGEKEDRVYIVRSGIREGIPKYKLTKVTFTNDQEETVAFFKSEDEGHVVRIPWSELKEVWDSVNYVYFSVEYE